ncbi:YhgE/Pip domain-containing protein [Streptococcus gallolyticus]|uniref:Phage infection protein n=1 Tax=Streptococcus gallolyticus TaxID=315405 RepID=A0A139R474_9STRE|nr:YhgE/Pip domain-containing protein [Streptococcus gallolyticus]KXU09523.1 Phage infection protein [Streptococcus gallolyticus]SFC70220.1 putative membrane protein [Streptococcus gallolyticus]SFU73726.1 putative membrane protein [Streptococcus gallolyticus]
MLEELKALIKSPKLWVTMIGVALIPALYNLSFLGSMWDPYGNVDDLPVAVVNQDKSSTLNDQTLSIGDDMVDSMSKNKALDYHFVSAEKAEEGLENGDYYMVITLPEDLSEKAASLLTDDPEKLTINYQTTAGRSFVASKMSESAMTKLKDTVSENITETYTKAVFKSMSSLQNGLQEASDGGNELLSGSQQLESGSQTITDNLNTAASGSQTLADGTATLSSGLTTYTNGVSSLASGSTTLSTGLATYVAGVNTLSSGLNELNANSQKLVDGVNKLQTESSAGLTELITGATKLNDALQTIQTQLNSTTLPDISKVQEAISDLTKLDEKLSTMSTAISSITSSDLAAVQATSAYKNLSSDEQAEIDSAITTGGGAQTVQQLTAQIEETQKQISQLTNLSTQLSTLSTLLTNLANLQAGISQASTGSQQLVGGLTQLKSGLEDENKGIPYLASGLQQYTSGVAQAADGANQLVANNNQLTSGASQVASGANQLAASNSQLTSGASQLQSGAEELASGSSQLAAGSDTLTSGLTTLTSGISTLTSSLSEASDQLSLVSVTNKNAKLVSNPVSTKETDNDSVKVNGIGMAPYMIAVSLMVVALSTNVIFASSLSGRPVKNRFEWAKQKLFINGLISTVGSLVLYGAIQFLGFEANYEWKTILLIILGGWTLMALVTALVGWDNRYGSFLSLIMLLLQVGSAGGSYPIELSPKFFQVVHPYMPMTYIVTGLRQTISMTGSIGTQVGVLSAFLVAFMVLGLIIYRQPKTEN